MVSFCLSSAATEEGKEALVTLFVRALLWWGPCSAGGLARWSGRQAG